MNPSSALATVLVDELVRGGVREAVLCPGSRSRAAGLRAAGGRPAGRLRLHVRVDERSAGFLALGLAKLTGDPVPVVTTSGTAVANLHPAVLEAGHAGVPLVVLSADRPPELRGTGANQTTDQTGFFGAAVRWSHELEAPARRPGLNGSWRSVVARGLCRGAGGPDRRRRARARQRAAARPARATPDPAGEPGWPDDLQGRPGGKAWVQVPRPSAATGAGITAAPRTLVVVGDLPRAGMAAEAVELARAAGWPVVAEPFGRYDRTAVVPHGPLLLGARSWLRRTCRSRCSSSDGSRWPGRSPRCCGTPAYGSRWSRPPPTGWTRRTSRPASCRGAPSPRAARPSTAAGTAPGPASGAEAGRQVAKAAAEVVASALAVRPRRGRPARGGAAAGGDPVRRLVQPGPRPGPGRRTRRARRRDAGGGEPRAGRHRRLRVHRGGHRPRRTGQPDVRADGRPDVPARPGRPAHRPARATPGPDDRGAQRRRRRHLHAARARRARAGGRLRAGLRHPDRHVARGAVPGPRRPSRAGVHGGRAQRGGRLAAGRDHRRRGAGTRGRRTATCRRTCARRRSLPSPERRGSRSEHHGADRLPVVAEGMGGGPQRAGR